MATTTNYSWTTPDDTALVKDGAAAIRTLGSSVDTTVKNLNPETTLGDLAYRSSTANVKTRLPLGTAGQVLAVNSGATAPEWVTSSSGGMTLLSTTTLSGTTTISSISQSYNSLLCIITGVTNTQNFAQFILKPNGTSNITTTTSAGPTTFDNRVGENFRITNGTNMTGADANNSFALQIDNYTSTTRYKPIRCHGSYLDASPSEISFIRIGQITTNSAITSLEFGVNTGSASLNGGTVLLYGVK